MLRLFKVFVFSINAIELFSVMKRIILFPSPGPIRRTESQVLREVLLSEFNLASG